MSSPLDLSGASDREVVAQAHERREEAYTELVDRPLSETASRS